jgi:hypothetical protein
MVESRERRKIVVAEDGLLGGRLLLLNLLVLTFVTSVCLLLLVSWRVLALLVRRLHSPSDEYLRRSIERIFDFAILVTIGIFLLHLQLLDPIDPFLHIVIEVDFFEVDRFADRGNEGLKAVRVLLIECEVDILLLTPLCELTFFLLLIDTYALLSEGFFYLLEELLVFGGYFYSWIVNNMNLSVILHPC